MNEEQPRNALKIFNIVLILLSIVLLGTVALLAAHCNATAQTIAEYENTIENQKDAINTLSQQYMDCAAENQTLAQAKSDLTAENQDLLSKVDNLRNTVFDLLDTYDEYVFWHKYAVIVTSTGSKYHTYGCSHVQGRTFWIYNIDAAKSKGYSPCLDCDPPQ